jgi:membrane protease subunit HflC
MRGFSVLGLIVLAALLLVAVNLTAYTVDRSEFVYVTQFGRPIATYDGLTDGGLHWKLPWPIQSVQRLDRRLQYFDLPETEVLTRAEESFWGWAFRQLTRGERDEETASIDRTITVVAYVCWRIPDSKAVDDFIRRVGPPDRARTILGEQIRGQIAAEIGQRPMDDLISTEPGKVDRSTAALAARVMAGIKERARQEYGIELVDVRLRRTSHPWQVREEIYNRIRSERRKKAEEYLSEGSARAKRIESEAGAKANDLINQAEAEAKRTREEADAQALAIRSEAYTKAEEFYRFLKKLSALQAALGKGSTVLLLSSQHELFEMLRPPGNSKPPGKSPAEGGPMKPNPGEGGQ